MGVDFRCRRVVRRALKNLVAKIADDLGAAHRVHGDKESSDSDEPAVGEADGGGSRGECSSSNNRNNSKSRGK